METCQIMTPFPRVVAMGRAVQLTAHVMLLVERRLLSTTTLSLASAGAPSPVLRPLNSRPAPTQDAWPARPIPTHTLAFAKDPRHCPHPRRIFPCLRVEQFGVNVYATSHPSLSPFQEVPSGPSSQVPKHTHTHAHARSSPSCGTSAPENNSAESSITAVSFHSCLSALWCDCVRVALGCGDVAFNLQSQTSYTRLFVQCAAFDRDSSRSLGPPRGRILEWKHCQTDTLMNSLPRLFSHRHRRPMQMTLTAWFPS